MEELKELLRKYGQTCCDRVPDVLEFITLKINKNDLYSKHPYECKTCGCVYQINREDIPYEVVGDFMCPNHTSYSYEPRLRTLERGNKKLQLLNKRFSEEAYKSIIKQGKLDRIIGGRIDRLSKLTDGLSGEQRQVAFTKLGGKELLKKNILLAEEADAKKQRNAEQRKILGLPPVTRKSSN